MQGAGGARRDSWNRRFGARTWTEQTQCPKHNGNLLKASGAGKPLFPGKKKPGIAARLSRGFAENRLGRHDLVGLQALLALHDLEADLLAFLQALEAGAADGTEVHEHVRAVVTADEAE